MGGPLWVPVNVTMRHGAAGAGEHAPVNQAQQTKSTAKRYRCIFTSWPILELNNRLSASAK